MPAYALPDPSTPTATTLRFDGRPVPEFTHAAAPAASFRTLPFNPAQTVLAESMASEYANAFWLAPASIHTPLTSFFTTPPGVAKIVPWLLNAIAPTTGYEFGRSISVHADVPAGRC